MTALRWSTTMVIRSVRVFVLWVHVAQPLEARLFDVSGRSEQDTPQTIPGQSPKCGIVPICHAATSFLVVVGALRVWLATMMTLDASRGPEISCPEATPTTMFRRCNSYSCCSCVHPTDRCTGLRGGRRSRTGRCGSGVPSRMGQTRTRCRLARRDVSSWNLHRRVCRRSVPSCCEGAGEKMRATLKGSPSPL